MSTKKKIAKSRAAACKKNREGLVSTKWSREAAQNARRRVSEQPSIARIVKDEDEILGKVIKLFIRTGEDEFMMLTFNPGDGLEINENKLDANTCAEMSSITLDVLQSMPIQQLEGGEPITTMSPRLLVLFALTQPGLEAAKALLAKRLVMNGFNEKELLRCMDGVQVEGRSIEEKVTHYLNSLQGDGEKIVKFMELAYMRSWMDDQSSLLWFMELLSSHASAKMQNGGMKSGKLRTIVNINKLGRTQSYYNERKGGGSNA